MGQLSGDRQHHLERHVTTRRGRNHELTKLVLVQSSRLLLYLTTALLIRCCRCASRSQNPQIKNSNLSTAEFLILSSVSEDVVRRVDMRRHLFLALGSHVAHPIISLLKEGVSTHPMSCPCDLALRVFWDCYFRHHIFLSGVPKFCST